MPHPNLTTDHSGWERLASGRPTRLLRTASGVWSAEWTGIEVSLRCIQGAETVKPTVATAHSTDLPLRTPPQLASQLDRLGVVHRLVNPWLWDALTTAILRQVVRAGQARELYRRWCQAHGMSMTSGSSKLALPPGPEAVLALSDAAFAEAGTAFHRTALQAAARAYLEQGEAWAGLSPAELVKALDTVPRIGPWTAQAAVADYTGDFAVYPHSDLAVRTWAGRVAPDYRWPGSDRAFEAHWRSIADTPLQLHTLTLLTLTWGSHAHSDLDRPGDHP